MSGFDGPAEETEMFASRRGTAEGELPLEYDWEPAEEVLIAYAGIPLFVRAVRSFDVPRSVERHLRLKQRHRGFDEATYVESFLVPNALGGGCLEDFDRVREDAEVICECAEPPWDPVERGAGDLLDQIRCLVIRVRRRQGELFSDEVLTKCYAVVTKRFDFDAKRLRFKIFCSPGKLIHHARRRLARVGRALTELPEWPEACAGLPAPA